MGFLTKSKSYGSDSGQVMSRMKERIAKLEETQATSAATVEEKSKKTTEAENKMFRNRKRRGLLAYTNDDSGGGLKTTLG